MQYSKVTYLSYILDGSLSGESMALHVLNKLNSRQIIDQATSSPTTNLQIF